MQASRSVDRPPPSTWVDLGHAQVPVWIAGDGPPVVFVHGWPLTGETWSGVIGALGGRFTTITFDLPGAGLSTWSDPALLSLDALSSAVVAVVRAVSPSRPVVLCGHDSGGGVARWAAAELGDQVCGMVLGNTEIPGVHSWRFSLLLGGMQLPGAPALTGAALKTALGRHLLLRDCVHDRRLIAGLSERFLVPLAKDARRLAGALAVIDGVTVASFDAIAEAHPAIRCPVALVWGTECVWFPLEGARAMCREFGGSTEFVEVPGAGLLAHEEKPEPFAEAVARIAAGATAA